MGPRQVVVLSAAQLVGRPIAATAHFSRLIELKAASTEVIEITALTSERMKRFEVEAGLEAVAVSSLAGNLATMPETSALDGLPPPALAALYVCFYPVLVERAPATSAGLMLL